MMGERSGSQGLFFYRFALEERVPADHPLRKIDAVLDLSRLRSQLAPHYSHTGRPSINPELMIRMLLIGYCYSIRSERRLCEEVHGSVVSASKIRSLTIRRSLKIGMGAFADILRHVFETTVQTCLGEASACFGTENNTRLA